MKLIPQIRFKGFTDDWEERKSKELCTISTGKGNTQDKIDDGIYPFYVRSATIEKSNDYLYDQEAVLTVGDGVGTGKVFHYVNGKYNLHQRVYRMYDFNYVSAKYFYYYFSNNFYKRVMSMTAKTSVDSVRMEMIADMNIVFPSVKEQEKIVALFSNLDDTIALHQRKLDLVKETKKGFLQKMFPKNGEKVPELRFAGFVDDWEQRKFKDILKTHSFRSYLAGVSENGEYEVIQQGDKPIVGYSDGEPFTDYKDVTLFGDHTVSLYKPKSPFFVATDGVKILSADNFEGDYLYTTLERYKPKPQGYKRHFTILKNQDVWFTKNMEEQQKIGSFFKQLDDTITLHQRKLDLLKETKKGFLQKMF